MPSDPLLDIPVSSAAHFVVRFTPDEHRGAVAAAFALAAELDTSITRCTDPGVTRLKLDWWRKELDTAGNANHPLARQLTPLATDANGLAAMHAMIDATEADILKRQPEDTQAFIDHCDRSGALARLLCLACGNALPGPEPLGRFAAAVERVQNLGRRLRQDHNPLPRSFGLPSDHTRWDDAQLAEACGALLAPLKDSAEQVLRDRAAITMPARRWARQALAVHGLLEREGYPVHRMHLDITPFSRLWNAWRVR